MKKTSIFLTVLTIAVSCTTLLPNGWIDQNTFRAYGTGYAHNERFNAVQTENSACKAAAMQAQAEILQKLAGISSKSVSGKLSIEESKNMIITRFSGTIKNGSIIQKVYNANEKKCTVVYEIREKNLRKKFNRYVRSLK